jgi:hypothetical protein
MKKLLIIMLTVFQFVVLQFLPAQSLTNNGAELTISNGSSLLINGEFRNKDDASIENSGDIYITGNWFNNSTENLLQGTTGTVHFTGSSVQQISGLSKTWFSNLHIQNNSTITLETSVSGTLLFDSATLTLLSYDLIMESGSSINGANTSAYIIINNDGRLVREVGNSDVFFPIGTFSTYVPISINNSGTTDFYGVRVFKDVLNGGTSGSTIPEIDHCVNITWDIMEYTTGGSNLAITTTWNASDEGSSFDRTQCGIGEYAAVSWDPQSSGAAFGSNPYSRTRSDITYASAFAVGDINSPMAITLDLVVDVTAFLEGPFNGTNMDTDLNPAYIPLSQPYNTAPWNYAGSESVGSMPNGDVVDWVLIELRDAPDAASATSGTMLAQQAAFILNNGSIVGLDGVSNLQFGNSVTQDLFVVVWHRNHLGVMSANALTSSGGVYSYNFTSGESQAYGGASGYKDIGTGIWGLVAGDGNADGEITTADKSLWATEAGTKGYLSNDYSMNSEVNNQDKNEKWTSNLTYKSQVPN